MVVSCDLDVLDMFRFNSRTCQIELIVDVGEDGGTLEVGGQEGVRNDVRAHDVIDLSDNVVEGLTSEAHNVQRTEGVGDVGEGSTVGQFKSVRKRNNVTRREHDDYLASLDNDEDGSLSDQSEHSDEDYSFSSANEDSGSSTDGLSSYESDNEDGRNSCDEEGKKGKTYVDITKFGQEFHVDGEDGKVILKENLLFENVDKFREALKEYTIQKGCKIVRVKNEKSRVTCHCAALGCPWRIHASPLPDGTTYKIRTYHGEHT
ncbi:hypothetical protein RHGRI_011210 [Rhododendron griersonianum]|uniref:Transposase MuDR plant domain-containing protein n=1 Tax=Rhododendron griersonianum TaxID=479676 RepID=A0AAV6KM00_9ERIC|nr:hypothetical protein RHGRI_011210 [Rhododendron griersonianum]